MFYPRSFAFIRGLITRLSPSSIVGGCSFLDISQIAWLGTTRSRRLFRTMQSSTAVSKNNASISHSYRRASWTYGLRSQRVRCVASTYVTGRLTARRCRIKYRIVANTRGWIVWASGSSAIRRRISSEEIAFRPRCFKYVDLPEPGSPTVMTIFTTRRNDRLRAALRRSSGEHRLHSPARIW